MNAKQIWQAALTDVRRQTSQANFDTWLRNTSIAAFEDGSVLVAVPNSFACEWLRTRFTDHVERALSAILGYSVGVKFVVQAEGQETIDDATLGEDELAPQRATGGGNSTQETRTPAPGLNPRYTFDEFIVGSSNQLAHAASLAVADRPGSAYNPLFLYGGVGLGKTHLLQAVAQKVHSAVPSMTFRYVSSETFTNELIRSIRDRGMDEFRNRYRSIDVLLIDDIEFIAGKETTQEEFFHTFNSLRESGKQIVLTSDRPPKALSTLENRLRSRFEGGLIADIQAPTFEHRVAILLQKALQRGVMLPPDASDFIASRIQSNIRELEGALNRIIALALLQKTGITRDLASRALDGVLLNVNLKKITPRHVVQTVADFYRIDPKALLGRYRGQEVVTPRHVAMYLMREEAKTSLSQIGEELGGRDHTTVLHGYEKMRSDIEANSSLRQQVFAIRQMLYEAS
jgi:chromosomal replication initiator protein